MMRRLHRALTPAERGELVVVATIITELAILVGIASVFGLPTAVGTWVALTVLQVCLAYWIRHLGHH